LQVPPVFSARKLAGDRAHRLARAGKRFELQPSEVTVHSIEVLDWNPPDLEIDVWVSTGTYVRALARDLGRDLGCGGHLGALRRTAIGPFEVEQAIPAALLADENPEVGSPLRFVSPLQALSWLPRRDLTEAECVEISHGRVVQASVVAAPDRAAWPAENALDWPVALAHEGELVAVAKRDGEILRPVKVLRAA
jgi:tRNA pseudouridine55 synthase